MKKKLLSPYQIYLGLLIFLNGLPFLAPLLLRLSESGSIFFFPAKVIYFIYSFFCHQFHHRSVHLYDYQVAWCTRDMGIWLGFLAAAIGIKYLGLKSIKWYWIIPFAIPMALDGGIQTIATIGNVTPVGMLADPVYISNNLMRFITGALFGFGVSLWLSEMIKTSFEVSPRTFDWLERIVKNATHRAVVVLFILFGIYVGLVGLWNVTSEEYKPLDTLDSISRTPSEQFFQRRLHGVCPTEADELFGWDCFLE